MTMISILDGDQHHEHAGLLFGMRDGIWVPAQGEQSTQVDHLLLLAEIRSWPLPEDAFQLKTEGIGPYDWWNTSV